MFDLARPLVLIAALALAATPALAQPAPSTPVSGFNPTTSAVSEGKLLGAMKEVTGTISIPDAKAAVLIQPEGKSWRDFQRGTVPLLSAVTVLGMIGVLAVFYLVRGRIRIEGGPSGRTLRRFNPFERFVHWLTAGSFVVLALTGLNLSVGRYVLLPVIGGGAFSELVELGKIAHNYLAFPFCLGLLLMLLTWVHHNIPNRLDIEWFRQGGGLIGKGHPPSGKFNGGQKVIFWIVVLGGGIVAASGFLLLFPFVFAGIAGMQTAQIIHAVLALLMIAAMLGHIYIGSLGMEGAFDAMGTGEVDETWARTHHNLWAEQEIAKKRAPAE